MKKISLLDTSVILEDENIIFSLGKSDICIPIWVLEELDKKKKDNSYVGENGRDFSKLIDEFPPKKIFNGGYSLGKKRGKIRFIMNVPYHNEVADLFPEYSLVEGQWVRIIDNLILNTLYHVTKEKDGKSEVVLITKDVNLRVKARSLGLKAEDYVSEVSSMKKIYKETIKIKIKDELINNLYSNPVFDFTDSNLKDNDFLHLLSKSGDFIGLGIYENSKIKFLSDKNLKAKGVFPKNHEQAFALSSLLDTEKFLVTMIGIAGTGKTLLSLAAGLELVDKKVYNQVLYIRDETFLEDKDKIGFIPGGITEKMSPFMLGLQDNINILNNLNGSKMTLEGLMREGKISIQPTQYIRGRTLNKVFVICDEGQNMSRKTSKTIITRAGEDSKFVILGDIEQIDKSYLNYKSNGLSYLVDKMSGQEIHSHIYFKDVQRSLLSKLAAELL